MAAIKPKIREGLAMVVLDEEAVIYDPDTSDIHHLNPTATVVLGLCDGTQTIGEMAGHIAEAYGVSRDRVERQVRSLVRKFTQAGILNGTNGATGRAGRD